ncbi:protein kinase ssp1 [Aspergillus tanneri]|uniref:Protein kinase ssp1 n=1 Tax=Aspergillus tanneri TaxID=1220188 RepID=A0A5M9N1S7_9EURO|nr:protein kinase ssp1 [Aspergillus tanneri]KAA8651600.1 protein kinase ssp1 [Aspergillus tanneri]
MGALTTSDYAAATDGSQIYLYYQNESGELREVTSADGSIWTETPSAVATKLNLGGSPITAYYVKHDGTSQGKSSIHVIYLDDQGTLHELVKSPLDNKNWEERTLEDDIKKAPIETSRLSSGICHDNPAGAHHGAESKFKWRYQKILPEKPASALPGTQIATNLTNPTTHLYFQDHEGAVSEYLGGYDTWSDHTDIIKKEQVEINTPIAAANSSVPDKPFVFYVSKLAPYQILNYKDGDPVQVAKYYPGTKLGAITVGHKVYLFHKPMEHPGSVWTRVSDDTDGSSWKLGAKVVT